MTTETFTIPGATAPTVEGIFENRADGVAAYVTLSARGYHVALKDLDAGKFLPHVRIFPSTMTDARDHVIALAKEWSNFSDAA